MQIVNWIKKLQRKYIINDTFYHMFEKYSYQIKRVWTLLVALSNKIQLLNTNLDSTTIFVDWIDGHT